MFNKEELEKIRKEGLKYVEAQEKAREEKRDSASESKVHKNKGRSESKTLTILIAVVSLSLVINYFNIEKIKVLEQLVEGQEIELRNLSTRMDQVAWQVNNVKEAEKWIADIFFEPNKEQSTPNDIVLDVQWEVRESENGATVTFLYRGTDDDEWEEVEAAVIDFNTFQASIHLDPKKDYEYQILSVGLLNKTSEVDNIPTHLYKPSPVLISSRYSAWSSTASPHELGKLKRFEASFTQEDVAFDFYKVKEVKAHYYIDEALQKTETLERTKNANNVDEWSVVSGPEITLIKLEIIYENGDVQWEEIYPHEDPK